MIDIHTHLYWQSYDVDRDEVIARAREAGVEKMIVIGTTVEESRQAVQLAEQYPELYASVGIHPHEFNEVGILNLEAWVREVRDLAGSKKVVAIGECGLDYYSHDPEHAVSEKQKADQEIGFLAQIALAQELRLPLIVHCRTSTPTFDDAYRDLLEILTSNRQPTTDNKTHNADDISQKSLVVGRPLPVILHCYLGDTEVTKAFLELPNVSISFAGNITYPVKQEIRGTKYDIHETVKLVPVERLFVETDCPFLAPQAHRGKRNEPAFVGAAAAQVAEIKGISQREVEAATEHNAIEAFGTLG